MGARRGTSGQGERVVVTRRRGITVEDGRRRQALDLGGVSGGRGEVLVSGDSSNLLEGGGEV